MNPFAKALLLAFACATAIASCRAAEPQFELADYRGDSPISVTHDEAPTLRVAWPAGPDRRAEMVFDFRPGEPLIHSLAVAEKGGPMKIIATDLDPVATLTIGDRDKQKAAGAYQQMVFFEKLWQQPHQSFLVTLTNRTARVSSEHERVTISVGGIAAGSFTGDLRFTFYQNSPLIRADMVMSTRESLKAILYDAGLSSRSPGWDRMVWADTLGRPKSAPCDSNSMAEPLAVKYRTVVAAGINGSIAVFPAPHQYFYPLDFDENLKFNWFGNNYSLMPQGFGFGIRQPLDGDRRWVPWFDAPAGTEQHLSLFYLVSPADGEGTLSEVTRYTHGDRFPVLPGYHTFTSHYHIEHTLDYLERQKQQHTNGVPHGLETPGFVTKFKDTGVDIVHLAEFHQGWTPGQKAAERLPMLNTLFHECARLSDEHFLLLPGEEPNVHLGGHWIALFPKPVFWILNRGVSEPFQEQVPGFGTVYHVGSPADVLKLMELENGLMWTAHARIKGSIPDPDAYRTQPFYLSEHFLGAAWKAMPANLASPKLGYRALNLFDDMNEWGQHKQMLGEVDVFQVQPDYELYGPINVNYLKLDRIPNFADGWQPVLDSLRQGRFFTTTGEVLVPRFTIDGKSSGETTAGKSGSRLKAHCDWTFPLAFAEVISGDGKTVHHTKIDLSDTGSFSNRDLDLKLDLQGQKWVRLEVWDIAADGAFTQPVWLE
jgi:hypothetical protein